MIDSHNETDADLRRRLQAEADAQNARVLKTAPEPRDRYYYLIDKAFKKYEQTLGPVEGLRVLVAGCSQDGVIPMARRGAVVTGIDIADKAIENLAGTIRAQGLTDRADVRVMNAEELDYPPGTFDLIACTGVIHHLDIEKAASSWSRALKPNGRVVMLEPMAWNPAAAVYRVFTPSMRTVDEHPLKPSDIRRLREHFDQVTVESYALTNTISIFWAIVPDIWSLKLKWRDALDSVDRSLMRWIPGLSYLGWSAVIECGRPKTPTRTR